MAVILLTPVYNLESQLWREAGRKELDARVNGHDEGGFYGR